MGALQPFTFRTAPSRSPFRQASSARVEGIWQGLKVFENADVKMATIQNKTMKGIKRSVRRFGTYSWGRNNPSSPRKDIPGILWGLTWLSAAIQYGESMKITAFYYLQYPDLPADPLLAVSEGYVEVAEKGDIDNFDFTYALTICTVAFLKQHLETDPYYSCRSLIVVERFEDQVIRAALEAILPNIDDLATKK